MKAGRRNDMRLAITVILTLTVLVGCGDEESSPAKPSSAQEVPDGWRAETYGDVTLDVPDTWKPGFSPARESYDGAPELLWCADNPESAPYVGRPEMGTDACLGDADYILAMEFDQETAWFDSPLPLGKKEQGLVTETIAVGDTRVTVASDDADVRARVLRSARVVDGTDPHGCPVTPVGPDREASDPGSLRSLAVCVYDHDEKRLIWSQTRSAAEAEDLLDAVRAAPTMEAVPNEREAFQTITLVLAGDRTVRWNVLPDLGRMYADGRLIALAPELVRPWAGDGIRAYVVGPTSTLVDGDVAFFRGMLG